MGPYAAVFVFAVGIFLSNFILNTIMMKKPFVGSPVSYADYFKGSLGTHLTGISGRHHLGHWDVVQHYCFGPGGLRDFLWTGAGCDNGCGAVGRVYLEGISCRASGDVAADCGDVWLLYRGTCADHHGAYCVKSGPMKLSREGLVLESDVHCIGLNRSEVRCWTA